MSFSFEEIWASMGAVALTVIITLFIMSIASVYVAIERSISFWKARSQSRSLAEAIMGPLGKQDLGAALKLTQQVEYKFSYLGHMLEAGLKELTVRFDGHGRDAAHRAMERAALRETLDLKKGTAILATVGSTAPFVGLVGTVFGIINAFAGMAESGSGGLASVSGGIAEALVTTALGIAVAIVGVWLFNYFNNRAEHIINDMSVSVQEFGDWIEKVLIEKGEPSEPGELAQKD
jgi:biopolymer transport protein ExbB/TolQ